ncbi:MAG: carbohydrate ABC transporter permease [Lachnospiraceae bacterium]|nr:carbohydrate ABC transporter permease [Lachnospiraceae bacterium]
MARNPHDASYSAYIKTQKIIRTVVCVFLCFMAVIPFYIMIINSTHASADVMKGIQILPGKYFGTNWASLMKRSRGMGTSLWGAMLHSLMISVPSTALMVYFSTLTAYGLTVYNFRLKLPANTFIMAILMIPQQVTIIGFVRAMIAMHLYDTYWPLIIPAIAAPSTYYFMKQYMEGGLSVEIIEAARIDGSGEFSTFNKIALPLMKPAMATQAIFAFVASWNNLYTPSMILVNQKKTTLPMFVQSMRSEQFRNDYGMIYLGLTVSVLPIFVVYFALSKYIIAGVALGGVKE